MKTPMDLISETFLDNEGDRDLDQEREVFYDGFREGMKAALEHVERMGSGLFGEIDGEENQRSVVRCMSKFADHYLDHADRILFDRQDSKKKL